MSDEKGWPREIWAAEPGEFDPVGSYVTSEHATVARHAGDAERHKAFHRYVDADIFESAEKYWRTQLEAETKKQMHGETAPVVALENAILSVLASYTAIDGELCLPFGHFNKLGLHREVLRGLMKSLKEQGLVEYYRGLTTEEGEFCGAGYSLTRAGYSRAQEARNG
ncbi:hypothetical protein [Martelella mangrovi]|uniref:Uncharacterized protein n=1 Tax=Martelella mangrovi TaxID=1397477 RepID=A0ABV2IIY9_9HYPH